MDEPTEERRVTLVCGPDHLRADRIEQLVTEAGATPGVTVVRLTTATDPVLAWCTLAYLLNTPATGTRWLVVLDDPVWLRRGTTGIPPINALAAALVRRARPDLEVVASLNPTIVVHGDLGAVLMHTASRVLIVRPEGAKEAGRMIPSGIIGSFRLHTAVRRPS